MDAAWHVVRVLGLRFGSDLPFRSLCLSSTFFGGEKLVFGGEELTFLGQETSLFRGDELLFNLKLVKCRIIFMFTGHQAG